MVKRTIHRGNDPYKDIPSSVGGELFSATYWDLWIAIFLTGRFKNDWEAMISETRQRKPPYGAINDRAEALCTHMQNLREKLAGMGLSGADLLASTEPDFIKKQDIKIQRKIFELDFESREKSAWMLETPTKLRYQRALRGHWAKFPISPRDSASALERLFKADFYTEGQSWNLEEKLSAFVKKHEARASGAKLFALYRAFLAVVLERMDQIDDSFGVIGDLYKEVFDKYVQLDRAGLEMSPGDFFQDLMELIIWEDYGLICGIEEPTFFADLTSEEVHVALAIVRRERQELAALHIDYKAENALTVLGMLCVQQHLFDHFVPLAKEMGTRAWRRIKIMAEAAESKNKLDLALAVYEACLGSGSHEGTLRKAYHELQQRHRSNLKEFIKDSDPIQ